MREFHTQMKTFVIVVEKINLTPPYLLSNHTPTIHLWFNAVFTNGIMDNNLGHQKLTLKSQEDRNRQLRLVHRFCSFPSNMLTSQSSCWIKFHKVLLSRGREPTISGLLSFFLPSSKVLYNNVCSIRNTFSSSVLLFLHTLCLFQLSNNVFSLDE